MSPSTPARFDAPDLHWPDPACNLANLACRLHGVASPCPPLQHPALARLESAHTVILLLIDGMGCRQLQTLSPQGWFSRRQTMTLSSVFPSTTTSAITTVLTGQPPSVHTLTGWHLAAPELDAIVTPLPLTLRWRGQQTPEHAADWAHAIYRTPSALGRSRRAHLLQPARLADSPYSRHHGGSATRHGWHSLPQLFGTLAAMTAQPGPPQFIYAYIPDLDGMMHHYGTTDASCKQLLQQIEALSETLAASLAGQDVVLCITADHGQIDIPPARMLYLHDYPALAACLRQPLSGEPRVAFCHVKPERLADFAPLAQQLLGDMAWCLPARQVLDEAWFGPAAAPALATRIGDYVLLMKEDWALLDIDAGSKPPTLLGNHGGLSAAEMQVPLLVIDGQQRSTTP